MTTDPTDPRDALARAFLRDDAVSTRNMYTCLPCPVCGSPYRCAFGGEAKNGKKYGVVTTIDCDDCGHVTEGATNTDGEWDDGRVLHHGVTPTLSLGMALERSQMTREDFARKILGVDPSTVYRWLHGRPIPLTVQDRITYYLSKEGTPDTLDPSP